ncbi:hypothetical protein [Actinomadura sp. 3N407]|uniref:hypothetical protein n=1 Tax=Actinomadura sp. 3N407 TaxID=3457423 RepID=UPI003FCD6EE9
MSLWRLELLRLVRTRRLVALLGVYAFFGLTTPFMARYQKEIFERFGGGVQLDLPPPAAADAIDMFTSNVGQLGVLTILIIAVLSTRLMRGTVGAIIMPIAALIVLGAIGIPASARAWVPTTLIGTTGDLLRTGDPARFVPGALLTLAMTCAAALVGTRLTRHREL